MSLSCDWRTNKQKLSERNQHLLETGQWSDCNFIVGQESQRQTLKAHKLFLATSSPVFEAMFFGSMAEKNDPIVIKDIHPEAFKALLKYIYMDKVELDSFELAYDLYYCAEKYMLPFLTEECTKYVWSNLSPKTVCRAYEFAKHFEMPEIMEKCMQIICIQTNKVLNESSWEDVKLETLLKVLEQDNLQISSEIELFSALERWATAECVRKSLDPTNEKFLRSVIGNVLLKIRFLSLTPQEFAKGPAISSFLTKDESFAIMMNICTVNEIPMPKGFSTNSNSRARSKYYLIRSIDVQKTNSMYFSMWNSSFVTFSVNKDIRVVGIQVPTKNTRERNLCSYKENVYAEFLDCNGIILTRKYLATIVIPGTLMEITFDDPVYIQKHMDYKICVKFLGGCIDSYPIGRFCTRSESCGPVLFTFRDNADSFRDSFIRSIIFTYHESDVSESDDRLQNRVF